MINEIGKCEYMIQGSYYPFWTQKYLLLELSELSWVSFRQHGRTRGLVGPWKSARITDALRKETLICSFCIYQKYSFIHRSENICWFWRYLKELLHMASVSKTLILVNLIYDGFSCSFSFQKLFLGLLLLLLNLGTY